MLMPNINDKKPLVSIITGDFNARSKNWWSQDITNSKRSIIDTLISRSGYHHLINLQTHTTNTSSFCINLVFTSNPSPITESGIVKSLYIGSCRNSNVFGKRNLSIPFPRPYTPGIIIKLTKYIFRISISISLSLYICILIYLEIIFQIKCLNLKLVSAIFRQMMPLKKL